jgi:site-specific DNA-methyltransferase (adenine-specific)
MGSLYFGDNLDILREHIKDESVDLVYLDPPFNSKRAYNANMKTPKGHESEAQVAAFKDTWHWGKQAEKEFLELVHQSNTDVSEMIQALRRSLKESDMMAYLVMMANRLVELHRVLKPTGSLYLHCDPTASHYLKIVLDMVFGAENFRNEIIWKRSGSHGGAKRWGPLHDTLFFYCKSSNFTWNKVVEKYDESYLDKFYRFSDERGRYRLVSLTGAGTRTGDSGKPWRGVNPTTVGRHWAAPLGALKAITDEKTIQGLSTQEKLDLLDSSGLIYWPPKGTVPQQKRYMDESEGVSIQDVITDILPISSQAAERLGYPTQKPLALLERIIQASSKEGDIVLDPFCGCGTAVHAAQILKREWIGIDITHLAISLIEKRMKDAFPGIIFEVHGTPKDLDGARNLAARDKYQFQWWACSLVNAQPYQGKKKGADGGTDGLIFFQDDDKSIKKIIVSVKGGESVTRTMIADLKNTVEREKAEIGLFVTLAEPTKPMLTEAVSAGFYESPTMGAFPKIQVLTIADLLSGKEKPNYPDLSRGGASFKKAKVEQERTAQKPLEGF